METNSSIGFVSSTISEPANESYFKFIIRQENAGDGQKQEVCALNPFDIVRVQRHLPEQEPDNLYAVVQSVSSLTDAPDHVANYVSQRFGTGNSDGISRIGFYCVTAKVLSNDSDNYFPVKTGDMVFKVSGDELYKALYTDYEDEKEKNDYFNVAGMNMYGNNSFKEKTQNDEFFVKLNKKYLVGPDAAHLNVSGMSGVASKTTKVMTILRELFLSDDNISIVIFNTKDRDLLNIQTKANNQDSFYSKLENGRSCDKWDKGIKCFEPYKADSTEGYILDFNTQRDAKNIDLLTAMDPDNTGTMDSCIKLVHDKEAYKSDKKENIERWEELKDAHFTKELKLNTSIPPKFRRVVSRVLTKESLENGIFTQKKAKNDDITTIVLKRLEGKQSVTIIDIAPLDSIQQGVVFGAVMRKIKEFCKKTKDDKRVAVFIDEFNKYASLDTPSHDPILESLIDIAEAGRSIGLCLITAEQSFSIINSRIKANYANLIFGRTGVLELNQPDYKMIPDSYKNRIGSFSHEDALIYTTYMRTNLIYAKFPDKFY